MPGRCPRRPSRPACRRLGVPCIRDRRRLDGSEGWEMVTIYPSLRVSANGAVTLLDAVDQGFKVVSIPDLTVRDAGTYEDVVDVALSGFGEALGIRMRTDELVVVRDRQQQRHDLPRDRARIRAFAL